MASTGKLQKSSTRAFQVFITSTEQDFLVSSFPLPVSPIACLFHMEVVNCLMLGVLILKQEFCEECSCFWMSREE